MAELGAYMGQGFANGITSTEDGVNRSMDEMTNSALDIATNAAQMLYDVATGQGSAEPIFTPILNLSDYATPTSWAATQAYTPLLKRQSVFTGVMNLPSQSAAMEIKMERQSG